MKKTTSCEWYLTTYEWDKIITICDFFSVTYKDLTSLKITNKGARNAKYMVAKFLIDFCGFGIRAVMKFLHIGTFYNRCIKKVMCISYHKHFYRENIDPISCK